MSLSRRTLLQALGLAPGGLFLPSLARAGTSPAKRIVFVVSSHGTVYDNWRMRTGGLPDDADFEIDLTTLADTEFSPILQPLAPFASKLLVLDGIGNGCGLVAAFNEHEEGHASALTGRIPLPVDGSLGAPDGPSIDQVIAASRSTPFPSLEYSCGGWSVNFDDLGQALPYEGDVVAAWQRLFPGGAPTSEPTIADRVLARQGSMLDLVQQRHDALAQRLSGEDRAKLEQHAQLVRDLEGRLAALAELQCEAIEEPDDPYPEYLWGDAGYPGYVVGIFHQLMAAALSCGLTDVITLRIDHINNSTIGAPAGDLHNDYAHQASSDPVAGQIMTDYHTWNAERLAELLGLLDGIPEGSGTMLDNTVVVWTNELATGEHAFPDIPVVIAGGSDFFDLGRYVRWAPTAAVDGPWSDPMIGPPHNQLLTTLGNAMGLGLSHFGVTELPSPDGSTIDCTGMLDRVCV